MKGKANNGDGGKKERSKDGAEMISISPQFEDVMEGSVYFKVDPTCCFPLAKIRTLSQSGVARLMAHFRGSTTAGVSFGLGGIVLGTDTPIVVEINGTLRSHLKDYFRGEGFSDSDANARIRSRETWYGIIDGRHCHAAVLRLMEESPESWEGFKWSVTLLKGGKCINAYRQLARMQNARHEENFHVETTIFDKLHGLKEEANRLTREANGKRPTAVEIAKEFGGAMKGKDSTIKQAAGTANRLPESVIHSIGTIVNTEHPDVCLSLPHLNKTGKRCAEDMMEVVDCRIFRKFLSLTSIKSCTPFMNAKGDNAERAQVCAIHRAKDICMATEYKSVSHKVLGEQFRMACDAIVEEAKFLELLDGDAWPSEMDTSRFNLLHTTRFDNDITENRGNDRDALAPLLRSYRRLFPQIASMKEAKHRASLIEITEKTTDKTDAIGAPGEGIGILKDGIPPPLESEPLENPANDEPPPAPKSSEERDTIPESTGSDPKADGETVVEGNNNEGGKDSVDANLMEDVVATGGGEVSKTTDNNVKSTETTSILNIQGESFNVSERQQMKDTDGTDTAFRDEAENRLSRLGIKTHQMMWQTYDQDIWKDDCPKVDAIITDPPCGLPSNASGTGNGYTDYVDDKEMKEFAEFCRRVLKTAGYVFLFASIQDYMRWYSALESCKFKMMKYPYLMVKDPSKIQRRSSADFAQNNAEMAIVARRPGTHPQGFDPDFSAPFHLIPCNVPRHFAAVHSVPVPSKKLTPATSKSPVRVEEKNVEFITEIIDTYAPADGLILDAYAGTLTTAIACLKAKRRCIAIEMDAACFTEAKGRLQHMSMGPDFHCGGSTESETLTTTITNLQEGMDVASETVPLDRSTDTCALVQEESGDGRTMIDDKAMLTENVDEGIDTNISKQSALSLDPKQPETIVRKRSKRPHSSNPVRKSARQAHNPVIHLEKGAGVELLQMEVVVATGVLQTPAVGPGQFARKLHGNELRLCERKGEFLIVVTKMKVEKDHEGDGYPYTCPGQEGTPTTLGDVFEAGVYSWDANAMRMK